MEQQLAIYLGWERPLKRVQGASRLLSETDVFVDFDWDKTIGHRQKTFPNYVSLVRHIKTKTRDGRRTALVLTVIADKAQGCKTDHESHDIFIVQLDAYKNAGKDVAAGYFAGLEGSLILDVQMFDTQAPVSAFDQVASPRLIAEWLARNWSALSASELATIEFPLFGVKTGKLIEEIAQRVAEFASDDVAALKNLLSLPNFPEAALWFAGLQRRKAAVEEFELELERNAWKESEWKQFFHVNKWIFGHGLLHVCLELMQKEAYVGGKDLANLGGRNADFALRTVSESTSFSALVEVKVPGTRLLGSLYRNRTYGAHDELSGAVSQIIGMCDDWNVVGSRERVNIQKAFKEGWDTAQPRGILVVGQTNELSDEDKKRCFELFRRHLHGLEILTFDELLHRAQQLVQGEEEQHASS